MPHSAPRNKQRAGTPPGPPATGPPEWTRTQARAPGPTHPYTHHTRPPRPAARLRSVPQPGEQSKAGAIHNAADGIHQNTADIDDALDTTGHEIKRPAPLTQPDLTDHIRNEPGPTYHQTRTSRHPNSSNEYAHERRHAAAEASARQSAAAAQAREKVRDQVQNPGHQPAQKRPGPGRRRHARVAGRAEQPAPAQAKHRAERLTTMRSGGHRP